jgi:hypothetical protein
VELGEVDLRLFAGRRLEAHFKSRRTRRATDWNTNTSLMIPQVASDDRRRAVENAKHPQDQEHNDY